MQVIICQKIGLQLQFIGMEAIRSFFTGENVLALWDQFYRWLGGLLENVFANFTYEPLKVLFINPYFWLIVLALLLLWLIFLRR
jgi:hypothetical protein